MGLLAWIIMPGIIPANVAPAWADNLLIKAFESKPIAASQFGPALMDTKLYISEVTKDRRTAYRSALGLASAARTMRHASGGDEEWLSILVGIAKVESTFNPRAISKKNAIGLMQVHWPTWGKILTRAGITKKDLFDPVLNANCGAIILLQYVKQEKGYLRKALYRYLGKADDSYATAVLSEAMNFTEFRNRVSIASHKGHERGQQSAQDNFEAVKLSGRLASFSPK